MESYPYLPLASDEIRLLDLLPVAETNEVHCHLRHVRLSDEPQYEAVSYRWGELETPPKIRCDGYEMKVTANLYSFLIHARYSDRPRTVWADAVCINQADNTEQSSQVQLMGQVALPYLLIFRWFCNGSDAHSNILSHLTKLIQSYHTRLFACYTDFTTRQIYSQAVTVLVWLGQASEGSDEAINLVNSIPTKASELYDALVHSKTVPNISSPVWNYLSELLSRDYFSRMWIIQEVALARNCVVLCGNASTGWEYLHWAASQLLRLSQLQREGEIHNEPNPSSSTKAIFAPIAAIDKARKEVGTHEAQQALALLARYRSAEATDSRDRIYALFGLIPQEFQDLNLAPDYRIGKPALYQQTAKSILEKYQTLDILSVPRPIKMIRPSAEKLASDKLPSWVPQWDHRATVESLLGVEYPGTKRQPHSTGSSTCDPCFSPDLRRLMVEGYCVDTIQQCVMVEPLEELTYSGRGRWERAKEFSRQSKHQERLNRAVDKLTKTATKQLVREEDTWMDLLCLTKSAGDYGHGWQWLRESFYQGRKTRRIARRLYPLSHIFPVYFLLYATTIALERFRVRSGRAPSELVLKTDMDFSAYDRSLGRPLFKTANGYIGLGPPSATTGDSIVLCKGGKLPLVLRRIQGNWELIGDCYISGLAKGELWDENKCQPIWIA